MPSDAHSTGSKSSKTYKVTITNLTVGEAAINGIQQITENGNGAPLIQTFNEDTNVGEIERVRNKH